MPQPVTPMRAWLAIAASLLGVACTTTPSPLALDAECYANRSWFPQRASEGMWDECVRQFGAAWCHKCLVQ